MKQLEIGDYKERLLNTNSEEEGPNETLLDYVIKTKRRLLQGLGFGTSPDSVNSELGDYLEFCADGICIYPGERQLEFSVRLHGTRAAYQEKVQGQAGNEPSMLRALKRSVSTGAAQNKERLQENHGTRRPKGRVTYLICIEGRIAPLCDRVGVAYNCKTLSMAGSLVPLPVYTIYKFTWKTKLYDDANVEFI